MAEIIDFPTPDLMMVPADDEDLTSSEVLDAAELSALEDPFALEAAETPIPLGRSWKFDHEAGRFVRSGGAPLEVRGADALAEWLSAGAATKTGAHPILPRSFGMEHLDDWIGEVDPTEALADFEEDFRAMAVQHDRVAEVDDMDLEWDAPNGVVYVNNLTVITDQEEAVPLLDLAIAPELT